MLDTITKKILIIFNNITHFFVDNLSQIVFLLIVILCINLLQHQPYFNLLSKYAAIQYGIIGVLTLILFRKYIYNALLLYGAFAMVLIAVPLTLVGIETPNDILGFVAFAFLTIYILRQVYKDRKILKEII